MFPGPRSVTHQAFTTIRAGRAGSGLRHFALVRVYIGSDHAGFELKAHLLRELAGAGHEVVDVGPEVYDGEDDYPPYCTATGERAVADPDSLGVVIGGSGNGEQIAANKVRGCRAALAWSTETAELARRHNNAQVVAVGARMHTPEDALTIVSAFLATAFEGGRHQRRIEMLERYEKGEPM
jgi:ribose 5-phosphate isomerase B